ncbi:MAG: hypothetical protein LKE53_03875 [Oscillospiraceae bacterium]|jgi:hypothetical protein|nr:hypothetical protein [Oscillospiraceae bacterium]MDD3261886.1 hypothetical protein [Oscillospiraceae bacterium]
MPGENTEILDEVYKVCSMGAQAADLLLPKVEDSNMRNQIMSQLGNYEETERRAKKLLTNKGKAPKEGSKPMQKAMLWGGIQMNTLADSSAGHLAEMMIQGTEMGIVDLQKRLNDLPEADSDSRKLAEDLIREEEKSIEQLKGML